MLEEKTNHVNFQNHINIKKKLNINAVRRGRFCHMQILLILYQNIVPYYQNVAPWNHYFNHF